MTKESMSFFNSRPFAIIAALFTTTFLIVYFSSILIPHFRAYYAIDFQNEFILPEENSYCPGDRMFYTVVRKLQYKGNVDIRRNWCLQGGSCPPTLVEVFPNIQPSDDQQVAEARTHRTIPNYHQMEPKQTWIYNETIAIPYQQGYESMYQVYFRIAENCPELAMK